MSWAHYLLQANIYLLIFYGFYKLLLEKETYFTFNRIYLLSAGLLSFIIPFLKLDWFSKQPVAQPIYTGAEQFNQFLADVTTTTDVAQESSFTAGNLISAVYFTGLIFFAFRFISQLLGVRKMLKTPVKGMAFSFFNRKKIDQDLPQLQTVGYHEEIHARQLHTLDILFFEFVGMINWFNPASYFYKRTIRHLHEYLADEAAANFQGSKEEYTMLLLSTAFGVPRSSLTNSFFKQSLVKKRIYMLHKEKSGKTAILKYGLSVPLFAMALLLSSGTIRQNEKIQAIANEIPLEQPLTIVKDLVRKDSSPEPENTPSRTATPETKKVQQDWSGFYTFIYNNLRYPIAARQALLQGDVRVKFTLKNGAVSGLGTLSKLGMGCEAEVMKTILAYENFRSSQDGNYTFSVAFRLPEKTTLKVLPTAKLKGYTELSKVLIGTGKQQTYTTTSGEASKVYDFVSIDVQPVFPGGMEQFYTYLKKSVKYPEEAVKNNIQGKVFMSFIVEKDGSLTDLHIDRKLGYGTDEEALRVMRISPKWTPGSIKGETIRVKYNIPISFTLSNTPKGPVTGMISGEVIRFDENTQALNNETWLKLKGSNSENPPLFILDGEKIDEPEFRVIAAKSIESISVLKKSSAMALYGPQARNGVVVISTKGHLKAGSEKTN